MTKMVAHISMSLPSIEGRHPLQCGNGETTISSVSYGYKMFVKTA